jgi:hypothetical protein
MLLRLPSNELVYAPLAQFIHQGEHRDQAAATYQIGHARKLLPLAFAYALRSPKYPTVGIKRHATRTPESKNA